MSPPEIILNLVAIGILLVYWGVVFVIFYHLARFGIGVQPKRLAVIFLFGSVILSGVAVILFMRINVNALVSLIPQ